MDGSRSWNRDDGLLGSEKGMSFENYQWFCEHVGTSSSRVQAVEIWGLWQLAKGGELGDGAQGTRNIRYKVQKLKLNHGPCVLI